MITEYVGGDIDTDTDNDKSLKYVIEKKERVVDVNNEFLNFCFCSSV